MPAQKLVVSGINRVAAALRFKRPPLARAERDLIRVEKLIDLYEPFILNNEQMFESENVQMLSAALPENERENFGYDPRAIDWWDYWINIHIPALRKWCYPLIEGNAVESRQRREFHLADRTRFVLSRRERPHGQPLRQHASHMAIFLTGATGYIGSYLAAGLLDGTANGLNLLVRAADAREAERRLWQSLQLHLDFPPFVKHLGPRIRIFRGDLTAQRFGLDAAEYGRLVANGFGVARRRIAQSQIRKKLPECEFARHARGGATRAAGAEAHGLRRFSQISTVAVAGHRKNEVVTEDAPSSGTRSDYDPYARTKKFCEHMVREMLPDVSRIVFRPSIVLGDSRRPETTQFDMVRAFVFLARLARVAAAARVTESTSCPVDYVADAVIRAASQSRSPNMRFITCRRARASETFRELTDALAQARGKMKPLFWPGLEGPFRSVVDTFAKRRDGVGFAASLLKVFLPYLVWNTVFDNARVVAELGSAPRQFSTLCFPLLRFAREHASNTPTAIVRRMSPSAANAHSELVAHSGTPAICAREGSAQ